MAKRIFAALLIAAMTITLFACAGGGTDESAEPAVSAEETESADESAEESAEAQRTRVERPDGLKRVRVSDGCAYTVTGQPHDAYPDDGTMLTDGAVGGSMGACWSTPAGSITIDLGKTVSGLGEFNVVLRGGNWGVVLPERCVYSISDDGKEWRDVAEIGKTGAIVTPASDGWTLMSFPFIPEETIAARYVRMDLSGADMNYIWALEAMVWQYNGIEPSKAHVYELDCEIDNVNYTNPGHMGDDDGPAYVVYSKRGYNKAEMKFELSKVRLNTLGTRGARVNFFVFLGIDVYDPAGGYWINCCDAGIYYKGENLGWQLFVGTYDDDGSGNGSWYHGGPTLDETRDYMLTLDSSAEDGYALLEVRDLETGELINSRRFALYGMRADGSNTSYLTNIAIDWEGEETMVDVNGKPTENWMDVMDACFDQDMYVHNIGIYDCALYSGETRFDWDASLTDRRCLCPDKGLGYGKKVINVRSKNDTEYIIDIYPLDKG